MLGVAIGGCALQPPPATALVIQTSPQVVDSPARPVEDSLGQAIDLEEHLELHRVKPDGPRQRIADGYGSDRIDSDYVQDMMGVTTPSLWTCPLVYVPPNTAVTFESERRGSFDWGGGSACEDTDWPSPATPWLVFDRNDNGLIDDGGELFGTGTELVSGEAAADRFDALAELDDDGDGALTPRDAAWSRLALWADTDRNRVSAPNELAPLETYGVTALSLDHSLRYDCDIRGNCAADRAAASGRGGELRDLYLRCR